MFAKELRLASWISAVGLLLVLGCGASDDSTDEAQMSPQDVLELGQPFRDWPKPQFVLVLSGDQHGFLEPCGCAEHQKGGLPRRHGLVQDLEAREWSPIGLDLGGLSGSRMGTQAEIKLNTAIEALKELGYAALGIGPEEVQFGAGHLYALSADEQRPTLLSANLSFFDTDSEYPRDEMIVEHGNWKIGITSIYGESSQAEAPNSEIPFQKPAEVLADVTKKFQDVDLRVLLAHASRGETEALLGEFPQFDLAVCTGGGDAPPEKPAMVGDTMLVQVGHKGMYVGVVGFFGDQEPRLRYQLIELGESWTETESMKELLAMYQEELRDQDVIGGLFEMARPHDNGADFVGAAKCGECHTKAFHKWRESRHAKAFEDLEKVKHQFDPECVTCHTTGWQTQEVVPYVGGFRSAAETPHLVANGCENCHGPGSKHVDAEQAADAVLQVQWRKKMQLTADRAQENLCETACHDQDNSPNFSFIKYWKEIAHPGKD